jgi:putative ATP-dependent endonuclease of the OLD family
LGGEVVYVKRVIISNFRGIRSADISFNAGLTILIGHNNTGKSTILSAIDLVLNPNLQWWRREVLTDLDFFRINTVEPILIELLIGCGRKRCIDEEDRCARLEVITEDKSEPCKLADRVITWDNRKKKFMKIDEIEGAEDPESVIRLKMVSNYQKAERYAETVHSILNEDGHEWTNLNNPMKEWIGSRLLTSSRDPMADCRMQSNSFLSRAMGDTKVWRIKCTEGFREYLTPVIKDLSKTYADSIIELVHGTTKDMGGANTESIVLGLGDVRSYDIMRQIELCRKSSQGTGEAKEEWEIPFSRQGRGMQNVASMALGIQTQNAMSGGPGLSVIMLEEPEQNLEPQMQRNTVKSIRSLCGSDTQIIMSTHSPYVLSSNMDLKGVVKLQRLDDGKLSAINLAEIAVDKTTFFKLRQGIAYEMELFETLFAPLVVVWEGDCEAGFYPSLMRQIKDYPSEWLAGIAGSGDFLKTTCAWFKKGQYKAVAVLDGDKTATLKDLYTNGVAFLALPSGKKIESVVADALSYKADEIAAKVLLTAIGASGSISWHDDFQSVWPSLAEIFRKMGLEKRTLPTDVALAEIENTALSIQQSQKPLDIQRILEKYKKRQVYEVLGTLLCQQKAVPTACSEVLKTLNAIWHKDKDWPLGQYQIDANGKMSLYSS